MTAQPHLGSESLLVRTQTWMRLGGVGSAGVVVILVLMAYLGSRAATDDLSQTLGNFGLLVSAAFATACCAWTARRRLPAARAWSLLAAATGLWTLGQVVYTSYGLSRNNVYPFPSLADVGYLGYAVLAAAALFAFPRPKTFRPRLVLDALVITSAVLFTSQGTVLNKIWQANDLGTAAGVTAAVYPVVDIAMVSVVLSLGMRQPPGRRLTWFFLGAGSVSLALTDSVYVWLLASGRTAITGTPLVGGWMLAFLLIGLAPLVPSGAREGESGRLQKLTLELIPYLPVLVALIISSSLLVRRDAFLLANGIAFLTLLTGRQVLIVYENVRLTGNLETEIAARTAELSTLGSIVTSSRQAIVGVSIENLIQAWNPAAERLYGHRASEVLGRPPEVLTSSAFEQVGGLLASARAGQKLGGYETDWVRPDGSTVPVALTVSPIVHGEVVTGISIFGQDISERQRNAAALEEARQEALKSARLKSEFLATMSHEIRTPMNGVIGLTGLLLDTDLDSQQRQYAEGVRGAGEALLGVINDILDFSKLEAGKVVLETTDFDPRRLVEDIGALLAPAAYAKSLELLAYCHPRVPGAVRGDAGRIRQVLLNLASNAVKFTAQGEVAVKLTTRAAGQGSVRLRFEVRDTGIGIAEADRHRLFQSFSQADASTTRRFGGTGLGLAISRRLVEAMGGDIGLDSNSGVGSIFWFEVALPLGSTLDIDAAALHHDLLTDLRVLVVDDNATNRTIVDSQLRSWRMQPELADSAASALALLRAATAAGRPFDLAVLDMCMPGTNGIQLARTITADPAVGDLPMIMLSSSLKPDPAVFADAGIGQWLSKPVRSSELYDRLIRLLAPRRAAVAETTPGPVPVPAVPTGPAARILVVEDNILNQLVAEGVVSRLGYEVHTVANGAEALAAMEAAGVGGYAAVLMDCHMPVMDGFTATREIRRRQSGSDRTPVIAMTAGALVEDRERCLAAGMDDYVSKPIDLVGLKAVLARWVPEPGALGAAAQEGELAGEPVLDESRLADLRGLSGPDGSSLLTAVVSMFLASSGDQLRSLQHAARAGDAAGVEESAHLLKGSAGTVGAQRVAARCQEVERALRGSTWPSAELLDELESELDRSRTALRRRLPAEAEESSSSSALPG